MNAYSCHAKGPTQLSIANPAAVSVIYGSHSKTSKGPWYSITELRASLHTARDKQEHKVRQKVWDKAFKASPLKDYKHRVSRYSHQLIYVIQQNLDRPIDMAKWFNYFAFDVMGDLAFGKSFNMLIDDKDSYFESQLHGDMKMVDLFSHLTWLFPFVKRTPFLNKDYLKFWQWLEDQVTERVQRYGFSASLKTFNVDLEGKDEQVFVRGEEFLPERWTTAPELIKDPSVFIAFGGGIYACVGKQLALMELRQVVAEVLVRYEVSFAPGQTADAFQNDINCESTEGTR
ncbi:cytochrome P450 monooxygenase [Penicillium argentinense]|uniref:Cytochrome P450 monooxygenase n=1 Tax=Penicillium argentinense TaxID=1131581 RepID=A0A9W9KLF8_9EURO|nr:cytochrome P450 monooxygenase [Penicillium argentinense]KAJ5110026.1 cytochrome P450 monooxygenase [Penicillium argentinense]